MMAGIENVTQKRERRTADEAHIVEFEFDRAALPTRNGRPGAMP
jgi:hypothetical protein